MKYKINETILFPECDGLCRTSESLVNKPKRHWTEKGKQFANRGDAASSKDQRGPPPRPR